MNKNNTAQVLSMNLFKKEEKFQEETSQTRSKHLEDSFLKS